MQFTDRALIYMAVCEVRGPSTLLYILFGVSRLYETVRTETIVSLSITVWCIGQPLKSLHITVNLQI